jgi:hypothetical protein
MRVEINDDLVANGDSSVRRVVAGKLLANERVSAVLLKSKNFSRWYAKHGSDPVADLFTGFDAVRDTLVYDALERMRGSGSGKTVKIGWAYDKYPIDGVRSIVSSLGDSILSRKGLADDERSRVRSLVEQAMSDERRVESSLDALMRMSSLPDLLRSIDADRYKSAAAVKRGVAEFVTRSMIGSWAGSSTLGVSGHGQRSASRVHGTSDFASAEKPLSASNQMLIDAFTEAEYEVTQQWFRERGITEVPASRGMYLSEKEFSSAPSVGQTVRMTSNPLSSWSWNEGEAKKFAIPYGSKNVGVVFKRESVPVSMIQSIPLTGRGCLLEDELILIGDSGEPPLASITYLTIKDGML